MNDLFNSAPNETHYPYLFVHKDLGLKIDVDTRRIKELHRIVINGVSFVRER